MATLFAVAFNTTDPRTYPSLAPTFLTFKRMSDGADISPPAISQLSTTGIYQFSFNVTTPHYFLLDGITVNATTDRYVFGVLDPVHQVDNQLNILSTTLAAINSTLVALGTTGNALGTTNVAIGTTLTGYGASNYAFGNTNFALNTTIFGLVSLNSTFVTSLDSKIGSTLSSIGTTSVDPGDLFGFLKRAQEFREGNQTFNKVSGAWNISTRGNTLIAVKTLGQSASQVTKS